MSRFNIGSLYILGKKTTFFFCKHLLFMISETLRSVACVSLFNIPSSLQSVARVFFIPSVYSSIKLNKYHEFNYNFK